MKWPKSEQLLSMLLVWDGLDVRSSDRYTDDDSVEAEIWRELVSEGLIRLKPRTPAAELPKSSTEAMEMWMALPWKSIARPDSIAYPDPDLPSKLAETAVDAALEDLRNSARDSLLLAVERGVAPVALDPIAASAATLPAADQSAAPAEGMLIQVAAQGVRVSGECRVEDVLAFRDKNRALMGRFRSALIDLAKSIEADSPSAAAEEARAVMVNRVEPALADLEAALKENRVHFFWNALIGASAVALGDPIAPAAAATGAGNVVARNLRYAFNRERLVRDHPFGLLHEVGAQFDRVGPFSKTDVTDPEAEAREALKLYVEGLIRSALDFQDAARDGTPSDPEPPTAPSAGSAPDQDSRD